MKLSTFRQDHHARPFRYRTPSPPSRSFIEPLSPIHHSASGVEAPAQWPLTENSRNTFNPPNYIGDHADAAQHRQSHKLQDSMDAFASIALSTTPGWPSHNKRYCPATPPSQEYSRPIEQSAERPAKRARSEKLPSPTWVRAQSNTASRPATSYESLPDNRTMEAELLLNFSHSARFSAASTALLSHHHNYEAAHPVTKFSQAEQGSCRTPVRDCLARSSSHGLECQPDIMDVGMEQSPQGSIGDAPVPSSNPCVETLETTYPPGNPSYDLRHQLIEASNLRENFVTPSPTELAQTIATLYQPQSSETGPRRGKEFPDSDGSLNQQEHNLSHGRGVGYPEDAMAIPEHGTTLEKLHKQESIAVPSPSVQNGQNIAYDYWPSMLATTVEQSMFNAHNHSNHVAEQRGACNRQSNTDTGAQLSADLGLDKAPHAPEPAICAACNFTRNSASVDTDTDSTSWISCDGCKSWFHFACAGFKSEREVRAVDKYRCRNCKRIHGPTTFVRKSARAHTAIDYAGLNQGVIKTSDERPEHHYIKPIKDGTINIQPEHFARMRPELVTAEHFEKGNGMKEPIVIPAELNPRPKPAGFAGPSVHNLPEHLGDANTLEDWFLRDPECLNVPDHGQDALDMVVPHNLTVRKVAELYGPEEKIEVIDVKSQNGEGKKWNMRRWADYYENVSKKIVRNVISLEVSQSTLGRLIRRPQIVRDLDLQDSVWPAELQAKGEFPRVQFYCLMSVADCFTDFHIDFGGSSVFYHILKGKKTFFFIPPKEKHLKKYEEWCMSPAQNWTFLGDQTKECYRVDLSEGDTMLIPAGWIHAVWTPEDSLVIGGNFLTRLNYSMQLRIAQVEKATGVARKFRYPHFQKIQWYTAIRYLESDSLPASVRSALEAGGLFHRQYPAYHDFNTWGENSRSGVENYHARYYSQPELEGLPDLIRYLLRTALIDSGEITEGITTDARNAVRKSIPRGFGEPLEIVKSFAIWCAWKRGNEPIPHWALIDAVRDNGVPELAAKLSGAALRGVECEATLQASRRHSARNQVQQTLLPSRETKLILDVDMQSDQPRPSQGIDSEPLPIESTTANRTSFADVETQRHLGTSVPKDPKRRKSASGPGTGSHKKTACKACRQRRRACKHKTDAQSQTPSWPQVTPAVVGNQASIASHLTATAKAYPEANTSHFVLFDTVLNAAPVLSQHSPEVSSANITEHPEPTVEAPIKGDILKATIHGPRQDSSADISPQEAADPHAAPNGPNAIDSKPSTATQGRGRSKACNECRRSKAGCPPLTELILWLIMILQRRCLHDEHGHEDPIKVRDAAQPRSAKRRKLEGDNRDTLMGSESHESEISQHGVPLKGLTSSMTFPPLENQESALMAVMVADVMLGNLGVSGGPASIAANAPQPLHRLNDCIESGPAQPSPDIAEVSTEDQSTQSTPEQDVEKRQTLAQGSIGIEGRDIMQQATTTPLDPLKYEMPIDMDSGGSFEQPAVSSLVSPPASPHDESEQANTVADPKRTYSGSSSRHSSRHATQTQRFTPESGPIRRDSSSSVVLDALATAEGKSVGMSSPTSAGQAPNSAQKRTKARLHSETVADEESLKLIRALQAQDYGLRRRGRAW
ncbi:MAG: hypothetical protein Q9182_002192 [Xanthomendoza sp. 2 TL-2023]